MLKTILIADEHTILDLPIKSGYVLDVGCQQFTFSKHMKSLGYKCYALEPDNDVREPDGIHLIRGALVQKNYPYDTQLLVKWSTGEGNHLIHIPGERPPDAVEQPVKVYTIEQITGMSYCDSWDVIKLDCEGAEYEVLKQWPGPIARQITVEFHDHTGANPGGLKTYDEIFCHLSQWYAIVKHNLESKYASGAANYCDSLFVLRSEL